MSVLFLFLSGAPNQQSNLMKRSMIPLKDISNLTQQKFPRKAEREQEQGANFTYWAA